MHTSCRMYSDYSNFSKPRRRQAYSMRTTATRMRNTSMPRPRNRTLDIRPLAIVFACSSFLLSGAARHKTIPAINEIEEYQQVGQHPYELTWAQREQDPNTVVDFEDLQGWSLELLEGAKGKLSRSREQQMWGESVAKFDFSS